MRSPRLGAVLAGAAVVVVYLAGAAVSTRLDPSGPAPLLDGLAPPPMYRWVEPPEALASVNRAPTLGVATIRLDRAAGSAAGVFPTTDLQAQIALPTGAIAPHAGDRSVRLAITPLPTSGEARVPRGVRIAGNVYRFDATYLPSGAPVERLEDRGRIVLTYPLLFVGGGFSDVMLRSDDGTAWSPVASTDSVGRQLVHADVDRLGSFAVGQRQAGVSGEGTGRSFATTLAAGVVALGVVLVTVEVALVVRERRRRSDPGAGA